MKKLISICLFLCVLLFSTFAQEQSSDNASNSQTQADTYLYKNIGILKVLNHPDAYVVIYNKGSIGTGQVVIPKSWFKYTENKAVLRALPKSLNPYMTVTYRNGEFDFVMLSMPQSFANSAWGVLSSQYDISSELNKTTLDIKY